MDRFLLKLSLGLPSDEEEYQILERFLRLDPLRRLEPVCSGNEIIALREACPQIHIHTDLLHYIQQVVSKTRGHQKISGGVSPRGTLALLRCSQALALVRGRDFVTPEDIKELAVPALAHRLILQGGAAESGEAEQLVRSIVGELPVPTEDWGKRS